MKFYYDIGYSLGVVARQQELARVPMNDLQVRNYIKTECKNVNTSISLVNGWLNGFDQQSIDAMKDLISIRAEEIANTLEIKEQILEKLEQGKTEEEIKNWVILQAIATLYIPSAER